MSTFTNISGLTIAKSNNTFDETYTVLKNTIEANPNIKIIAEVNHKDNATSADLKLTPSRVLFFGNPNLGTPLMQKNQLAGLDLPQKIIVFEKNKEIYLGFNATNYLTERHQLDNVSTLLKISNALTTIATKVSGNDTIISTNEKGFSGALITTKKSTLSFDDTYNTLKTIIENNPNLRLVKELDHQKNANNVGLELRPTRLIIFGNPKLGTPLMQNQITTGIDLPQKMLVWEDANNNVKISYNTPDFLKLRHGIKDHETVLETIKNALDTISNKASGL